jgi:toxin ParE1/3/4
MAYRVELSRRAELDLRRIFEFIYVDQSPAALAWFEGLEELIQSLGELPRSGTATSYDPKLFFLLYGNKPHRYRILYRVDPVSKTVAIRHIRHGARKPLR